MRKRSEVVVAEEDALDELHAARGKARAAPLEFPSAQPAVEHDLLPGFDAILETVLVKDVEAMHRQLQAELHADAEQLDYGSSMRRLDRAEWNARLAHNLWLTTKLEVRRWELDNAVVNAACRERAMQDLQREKEGGTRTKIITDADVDKRAALLFPDEYRASEMKQARAKRLVDSMQNLVDVWMSRCRSLGTAVSKMRT